MASQTSASLHTRDQQVYLQTFNRMAPVMERGEGCYLWDTDGKRYIDALAGIAVNGLGHAHPKWVKAVQEQAAKLAHISNIFLTKPQLELSEKLVSHSGLDRVFFTNSGAESLEGSIKLARKYAYSKGRGGTILTFEGAFHGRTLATIAATGKAKYLKGFGPIPTGFCKMPFGDLDAVARSINQDVAAVLIEPIQGEGGIRPAGKEFLKGLRKLCSEHGVALIFDEVQCGIGRTGHWFAKDYFDVQPDILALAKGLGGGVPVGAFLACEDVASAIEIGDHGTTFGGNPLVCAAALATLEIIEEEGLLEAATQQGAYIRQQIETWNEPKIKEVRGVGLMLGLAFDFPTRPLVVKLIEKGVITNATADTVLRLVPPLIITKEQVDIVLEAIRTALNEME
jgi:acetylornithine/N-succinyldiaminopimelate aminotransferase